MQALWMVLGSFFFATMAVEIKIASVEFNLFELLFYRGAVSVIFLALVLRARGTPLRTPVPMMHAWRTVIGVLSLGSWFFSIAHLPLATAMTLNDMSGVWVAAFIVGGAVLYGHPERPGRLMATVPAGFAGEMMMLRPTLDQNQLFAGLIGLLSGLGAALAYMQVTALGKAGEPEGRTVFYFSLTRAYSRGSTLLVANLQYSGIVFAAFYSLLLLGDQIPLIGWAGIGLIVASGLAATMLRTRALPDTPAEER